MLSAARIFAGFALGWISVGCGEDQPQYIKDFAYDVRDNQVTLEAEFSSDVSLNTDFVVPILNYGEVSLIANNDQYGFRIKTSLNMDALVDPEILSLSRTRKLPNNQMMSPYVETDVGRMWIKASDDVATSVYFGLEPEKFYLGVAVELNFIDDQFPAGLVLSQRVRDNQGRMLAVVSLYGPEITNGEVTAPGGLFIISNVSELASYLKENPLASRDIQFLPDDQPFVNDPDYESLSEQYKLLKIYQKSGKKAGYVD